MKAAFQKRGLIYFCKIKGCSPSCQGLRWNSEMCDETGRSCMRPCAAQSYQEGRSCRSGWTRRSLAPTQVLEVGLVVHGQAAESLIVAEQNSFLPPEVMAMFLNPSSPLVPPLSLEAPELSAPSARCVEEWLQDPCRVSPESIQQGDGTQSARLAGELHQAGATGTACSFLIFNRESR